MASIGQRVAAGVPQHVEVYMTSREAGVGPRLHVGFQYHLALVTYRIWGSVTVRYCRVVPAVGSPVAILTGKSLLYEQPYNADADKRRLNRPSARCRQPSKTGQSRCRSAGLEVARTNLPIVVGSTFWRD